MADVTETKRPHTGSSSDSPDNSKEESHTQPEKHAKIVAVDKRQRIDVSKTSSMLMKKAALGTTPSDQLEAKRSRVKMLQAEFDNLSLQLREQISRRRPHDDYPRANVSAERSSAATRVHGEILPPECDEPWEAATDQFDALSAAKRITDEHIELLKTYNDLKDTAKDLSTLIASQRNMTLVQVMEEMGVEMSDK
ncbi:unnamed protein product [[Candida] boidinii]|uniref:Unnamed protein product n=1 Tax=Candida boidinii TaxID=5477 RepID=A0ACB5TP60_CANBO|nr:unnamed protein product [[Candida] boidinii]GME99426.1 unnamed protein product [[Candida] boidinii]